jgi:hypothetical protein
VRAPRQAIKGYQGVGTITNSVYYLPLLDVDGNIQVICAHGVDEIAVVARTRLPPITREIFPVIRAYMPWMETGAGHVELLIGLDNRQWLPAHVEDSWDPDDDMRLMRSVFGHRYMITDGWGRDLLPPDNARDNQAGAQGGVEPADAAQEVQLQEYRGWSQGTWSHENGGRQDAANPGGGCLGACPRSHGATSTQGAPATQRTQAREAGQEDPAESFVTYRCPRLRSGRHALRLRGERGRGLGRYHLRRKGHPLTLHLRLGGAAGAGADRVGEGKVRAGQSGCSRHVDGSFPTQEGCQARYS